MCFFGTPAFFSLPAACLSSCSRLRGTCSGGSKWEVPSGRDSEHVEPSRHMQTHAHNTWYILTRPTAHAISMILKVVNVARHYLVMERCFPDT